MSQIHLRILQAETGKQIRTLMHSQGYSVKDVQKVMGLASSQAVYKWLAGKSLPSIENLLILSMILKTGVEDILVVKIDQAA